MAEPLWTSEEMLAAMGGRLEGGAFACTGVSIDSRSLAPGDLFVALAAERDGHEFVAAALEKGAAAALVSQPGPGRRLIVDDTLKSLEKLGAAARDRAPDARRGAVTGSVGKTSLTQMIRAGLERAGVAHGSVKSFNNHIGVPLTLARMPRMTERAIFEIGMNHAGEIAPLVRLVRPQAVAITNVGPVHTENFHDGESGVAGAKAEIFEGLEPGGVAVLNADNPWFDELSAAARARGADVAAFGSAPTCAAQLTDFRLEGVGARATAVFRGRPIDIELRQIGAHWGLMSLAALLMLEALDVGLDDGLAALAAFEPLEGRGAERSVRLAGGGVFTLIDESYNANPVSVAAALRTLSLRKATGRRIVVLTDMLELGPQARAHHAALAREIEIAGVDLVFCAGPLMEALWGALPAARRGSYAPAAAELVSELTAAVAPGDLVMVKGSKASNAGSVAAALAKLDQSPGEAA
jgi:UDP-N-acetylmuramoyl-tripeptide--D-alanyl-D-alanine ligase